MLPQHAFIGTCNLSTLRLWCKEHNLKEQTETDYKKPPQQTMAFSQINNKYTVCVQRAQLNTFDILSLAQSRREMQFSIEQLLQGKAN